MKIYKTLAFLTICILVLVGCNPGLPAATGTPVPNPTPTVHAMFVQSTLEIPLVLAQTSPQSASEGTGVSSVSAEEDLAVPPTQATLRTVMIYDENIEAPWQIFSPGGMSFNPISTLQAYQGKRSLEVTPTLPESKLYITLMPGGGTTYLREEVIGVSFWLYSGEEELDLYDLAVTAIGSNQYPYYRASDRSGETEKPYEETFLYWLGFNDNIPPKTWVEVQIWLNEMLYDPEYRYVTGLYLTNRFNFKRTFYIDQVSLILADSVAGTGQDARATDAGQESTQPAQNTKSDPSSIESGNE